ncbi:MAG: hypothetical protein AAF590_05740 [Pseudomonadota bacterium]
MNLNTFHPLASFDLLAIGIALVIVMSIIGLRMLTGRPWRRTLPPDEIDDSFSATSDTRPRAAPPRLNKDNSHDPR